MFIKVDQVVLEIGNMRLFQICGIFVRYLSEWTNRFAQYDPSLKERNFLMH